MRPTPTRHRHLVSVTMILATTLGLLLLVPTAHADPVTGCTPPPPLGDPGPEPAVTCRADWALWEVQEVLIFTERFLCGLDLCPP